MEASRRDIDTKEIGQFTRVVWRIQDAAVQWLWFALPVPPERIGYGRGPLTWLRQSRHRKLRRSVHICLLDYRPEGGRQSKLTEFWINERSRACSASLNEGIEDADVVWVYCKDPIPPHKKGELLRALKRAKPGTPVINHPEVYNAYHQERTFTVLAEAGVNVPRSEFTDEDIGKTLVVYKTEGRHGHSPKFLSEYTGPRAGYRAFEFVDSRGPEGWHKRYRAYYIFGAVYPHFLRFSDQWNVHSTTSRRMEAFAVTPIEVEQIRLIATTLGLQYFAVDYLRKDSDSPVFVDINVYPGIPSKLQKIGRKLGYYGQWHQFDDYTRLELSDLLKQDGWNVFDEAMLSLLSERNRLGTP
jgi:hypothetical protein